MATSRIKRQRKQKRIDTDGDPEFQVAPMVDVLLVLMLFFMMITSTEVLKKNKNLQLASAEHGKKPEKAAGQIVINIEWIATAAEPFARIDMDGVPYNSPDDMVGALQARIKQNPASYVVIRCDKDTQYSNVADVMKACAGAGIDAVTFAVLTGGGKPGAAPAAGE